MMGKNSMLFVIILVLLVTLQYSLGDICIPQWVESPISCRTNNTYIVNYYDQRNCNSTLSFPASNSTEQFCNYCTEDIQPTESDCIGMERTNGFVDNNYYSCCAITNLESDCDILVSPYNETINSTCFYGTLSNDMGNLTCQKLPNMGVADKEYCLAHIPMGYMNETFKCIANIRDGDTGYIVQTNPEYKETSKTTFWNFFLNWNTDTDTRQYFSPANSIVNFYFTGKNLQLDKNYILAIECSSDQRNLVSETIFKRDYEDLSFVFFRLEWLKANVGYIIGGIIALILLFIVGVMVVRGVFK